MNMRVPCLLLSLFLWTGCVSTSGSQALTAIADDVWERRVAEDLAIRAKLGLPVEQMPDPSYEKALADAAAAKAILIRLDAIDESSLTAEERVLLRSLRWQQKLVVEGLDHFYLRSQVTPYASAVRTTLEAFRDPKVANDPKILQSYVRYIDALTAVVREQERRGIRVHRPEIPAVRALFARAPISAAQPAHDRFLAVLSTDYEAAAPASVGLGQQPGGADAYRHFVRASTSLDLDPQQVHELGLREIARIEAELDAIRTEVGFEGDRAAFVRFLKSDPRFFESSAEGIASRLEKHVRTIEPHLPRFFRAFPRASYGVARLDPALEGAMTFGYYKWPTPTDPRGLYYFNGSKTSERNLLFSMALMAHELVPGHHFQIARQSENTTLHPSRRESFDTAFVEGWGEYAAALGADMGVYTDPYDRAGRLMMDSMLSARLVVDTGMNALGWSRERAMAYLSEHSMLSETETATETLRYATDIPAQALAYKIGSLKMMELRNRAQSALGDRFDIREFHEWILAQGSMPLGVLEAYVDEKIANVR
jgi:uncharacterized protein (DUF885 family)